MQDFLFIAIPYAALFIFIIGSVFRYSNFGFKVSSLSSQFLEGNTLFWGSRPFHWGVIFLFFGHLVAFLFPKSVILWNTHPVRLLILEISAFSFAVLTLFGLLALIYRRLVNKKLQVVTSKMDVAVYVVLLIQVISGMYIAYFYKWGSSWLASSLTPYIWSIFSISPNAEVIIQMPFMVQLHVTFAFVFIAMIPFTRWMHFLVYPFSYIWRAPQLVIWNWDRKKIRTSGRLLTKVKRKNA